MVFRLHHLKLYIKAIELMPEFGNKSNESPYNWFIKFRERSSYANRKVTKIFQFLPPNFLNNIRDYLLYIQKDVLLYQTYEKTGIIVNIDETPIVLEPITNITSDKIGTVSVKIRYSENLNREHHVYYVYLVMEKKHHLY